MADSLRREYLDRSHSMQNRKENVMSNAKCNRGIVLFAIFFGLAISNLAAGDTPKAKSARTVSPSKSKVLIRVLPGSHLQNQVSASLFNETWNNPAPDRLKGIIVPIEVDESLDEVHTAVFSLMCLPKNKRTFTLPIGPYPLIGMELRFGKETRGLWSFNHVEVTDEGWSIKEEMVVNTKDNKNAALLFVIPKEVDMVQLRYQDVPQGKPFGVPM